MFRYDNDTVSAPICVIWTDINEKIELHGKFWTRKNKFDTYCRVSHTIWELKLLRRWYLQACRLILLNMVSSWSIFPVFLNKHGEKNMQLRVSKRYCLNGKMQGGKVRQWSDSLREINSWNSNELLKRYMRSNWTQILILNLKWHTQLTKLYNLIHWCEKCEVNICTISFRLLQLFLALKV